MGGSVSKTATNAVKAATEAAVTTPRSALGAAAAVASPTTASLPTGSAPTASARFPVKQGGPAPSADGKRYPVDSASSTKSSTIRKDAADPSGIDIRQISKNLASLGQATIADAQRHNAARFGRNTQSADVLARRQELAESESSFTSKPSGAVQNRLSASALTTLLDARKEIKISGEMRKICDDFNCDEITIQRLTRYITSPSLSLHRNAQHEKDDTYLARWVDPAPLQERIAR